MTKLRSAEEIAAQIQIEKERLSKDFITETQENSLIYFILCTIERILFKDKDTGAIDE